MNSRQELDIELLLLTKKPVECTQCKGRMFHVGSGRYECEICGAVELDDLGRVKQYLEDHGPATATEVALATGVELEIIDALLNNGRVEMPEGSRYYSKCGKCGCSIRHGKYCAICIKGLADDLKEAFVQDAKEKNENGIESGQKGSDAFSEKQIRKFFLANCGEIC